jgi:pseudoazurin
MSGNPIALRTPLAVLLLALVATPVQDALAKDIPVRTLNRGPDGSLFVFAPEVVRITPGDSVDFLAVDKGHEVHFVPGMIPHGAEPFDGPMNQDARVTFTQPGVYVVACKPHAAMGMVAVIVVGEPVNIDNIEPSSLPGRARTKLQSLLATLK